MVLTSIMISLISSLVFLGVNGLILLWVSRWIAFKKQDPKTAFSVSGIAAAVSFVLSLIPIISYTLSTNLFFGILIFIVNTLVLIWLIVRFYKIELLKALLVWAIIFIVDIVIGFILGIILAAFAGALGPGLGTLIY